MGFFSFTSKALPSNTVEQRSHDSINLGTNNPIAVDAVKVEAIPQQDAKASITAYINQFPNNMFVIDGEKLAKDSIICTDTPQGKSCLKLQINLIELFKTMQNMNYFCSLTDDIDSSHFECRKIN